MFGEKQNEDPRYQEVKSKRMELLENRRRFRLQLHNCDEETVINWQLELVMVGRRARKMRQQQAEDRMRDLLEQL